MKCRPTIHMLLYAIIGTASLPLSAITDWEEEEDYEEAEIFATERLIAAIRLNRMQELTHLVEVEKMALNNPDKQGDTPLLCAVQCGNAPAVSLLLRNGANADDCNARGNTALHLAAEAGHAAIVRMLLQHGVNADTKGDFSWTALMYAIGNGHSAVAEYLLAAGANPNAADKMGQTPLLMAAQRRQKACAACIYRAGGRYGDELISAVLAQNTTELEQLLRNGANPNSCAPNGDTALMLACSYATPQIRSMLLHSKDIQLNARNAEGNTALILAAQHADNTVLQELIRAGANVHSVNNRGHSALSYALVLKNELCVKILLSSGAK